jgi:cell wall-associated NlpC family hydrolase
MNLTPYVGREYKADGQNCYDICVEFAKNELDMHLPQYCYDSDSLIDDCEIHIRKERSMLGKRWIQVEDPDVGDLLIFRIKGRATHCGICVSPDMFLHSLEGRNSTIEDIHGYWEQALVGAFRWLGK